MSDMFQVIHDSSKGMALYADDPKREAYKHIYFMQRYGYQTRLIVEDGMYTVESTKNGTMTSLTWERWPEPVTEV